MKPFSKVAVIGAGAFGTAMAKVAGASGKNTVKMWARDRDIVNSINHNHSNPKFCPNLKLPETITATTHAEEALKDADIVMGCLPTQVIPKFLEEHKNIFPLNAPFVSCSKGMIISKEKFLSEEVEDVFGKGKLRYCILSGPSFAQEILEDNPTIVVIASKDTQAAKYAQEKLSYRYFRVYTHDDVIGVEIAGALKNILAIGAGIIEGSGYGINTTSAFIARGTKELYKFAKYYNANPQTLFGLSGIGDIMLTSFGKLSRNRTFGYRLGKGEKIHDILKTSAGVVEGYSTLEVVIRFAKKHDIKMPIIEVINGFVHGKIHPKEALDMLMLRNLEDEFEEDSINGNGKK